jgi:hypothetical protein
MSAEFLSLGGVRSSRVLAVLDRGTTLRSPGQADGLVVRVGRFERIAHFAHVANLRELPWDELELSPELRDCARTLLDAGALGGDAVAFGELMVHLQGLVAEQQGRRRATWRQVYRHIAGAMGESLAELYGLGAVYGTPVSANLGLFDTFVDHGTLSTVDRWHDWSFPYADLPEYSAHAQGTKLLRAQVGARLFPMMMSHAPLTSPPTETAALLAWAEQLPGNQLSVLCLRANDAARRGLPGTSLVAAQGMMAAAYRPFMARLRSVVLERLGLLPDQVRIAMRRAPTEVANLVALVHGASLVATTSPHVMHDEPSVIVDRPGRYDLRTALASLPALWRAGTDAVGTLAERLNPIVGVHEHPQDVAAATYELALELWDVATTVMDS